MQFIDTHSHLYSSQFDEDRTQAINDAISASYGKEHTPSIHATKSGKPWVAGALRQVSSKPTLVVCPRPEIAREVFGQIISILGEDATDVFLYPEREPIPYERLQAELSTIHQRLVVLQKLQEATESESSLLVVTSVAALAQKTLDSSAYHDMTMRLCTGETIPQQTLPVWCSEVRCSRIGLHLATSLSFWCSSVDFAMHFARSNRQRNKRELF